MAQAWTIEPIATVHSPFQEKFGIPRQSGLTSFCVEIQLNPERVDATALAGIHKSSHLWLIFGFHAIDEVPVAATVRPPRLGGNTRTGVYGTRSPFRPNRLGLSLVRLEEVQQHCLQVSGADLLDQTPIFDIKPYVAYCDQPRDAKHWAQSAPSPLPVLASPALQSRIANAPELAPLWSKIQDYIRWDPRPAYRKAPDPHVYRQRFENHEIQFRREDKHMLVESIEPDQGART